MIFAIFLIILGISIFYIYKNKNKIIQLFGSKTDISLDELKKLVGKKGVKNKDVNTKIQEMVVKKIKGFGKDIPFVPIFIALIAIGIMLSVLDQVSTTLRDSNNIQYNVTQSFPSSIFPIFSIGAIMGIMFLAWSGLKKVF